MHLNIDQLKKKIIYRSNYRGTKEMDKLLGAFTKKYIESLSIKDLKDLSNYYEEQLNLLTVQGNLELIEKIYNANFQMLGYRRYRA